LSIGYISGQAKSKRQKAKEGINNQFLITRFGMTITLAGLWQTLDIQDIFSGKNPPLWGEGEKPT
jgi:hypothetical protein